jgi:hypothetical protein
MKNVNYEQALGRARRDTTECPTCGGGTGQSKPCNCAVRRQSVEEDEIEEVVSNLLFDVLFTLEEVCAYLEMSEAELRAIPGVNDLLNK